MVNGRLPDLGQVAEIVPENIRATGAIYSSAMLEETKIFQVADSLVSAFQNGMLPVSKRSSRRLYQYWREEPQRLTATDRKNLYKRVLGIPGGDEGVIPNRDFNDLWVRFVSSVSQLTRQNASDLETGATANEDSKAAGRELAQNLSAHGYGPTYFAAEELQKQINQVLKLLSDPEIQRAYGARDMWQVVDQIANLELGGAADTTRYRTLAAAGANIIAWIAKNGRKFSISHSGSLVSLRRRTSAHDFRALQGLKSSTDAALLDACAQWLAVSGTTDGSVDAWSQPYE